jgi:hypothetical protein
VLFEQISNGIFKLSGSLIFYLLLFIALNFVGNYVQEKIDTDLKEKLDAE